ncbi:MAG: Gfo/Idh/MocA family oxidoreductase [Actinobacteria bacterium]|nr:Gfo/Idh/MocA family oxidoreductase [Actinomycetota bacterium]
MSDNVNIAIVGCGGMGSTHARRLSKMENVNISYLIDKVEESAQKLQREVGAKKIATDIRQALDDKNVGVIIICTHHHLHAPMSIASAQAGKHIFCEKPLALTMDDCIGIAEAVEKTGVKFMMGFQARFSPFVLKLKEIVPQPWVTISQLIDPKWGEDIWANDPIEGGGNVLSQGCHCFDATCFLNDSPVVSIYAEGGNYHHLSLPIIDTVACTLRFSNNSVANITIGDFGNPALMGKSAYQVFEGNITATLYNYYSEPEVRLWGTQPAIITTDDIPGCGDTYFAHGYTQQMQALIDWIGKDIDPINAAKVRDGVKATELALKAFESIRTHQPQAL